MNIKAALQSFTMPATIGHQAQLFLEALDAKLPEKPTQAQYETALKETLALRRFRELNPGLRALAEAAWMDKGTDGIKCYLAQQAEIAFDAETRDRWNRDVRQKMGPILQAVVRAGKKELTTADAVQAFALDHGLPLLAETIRDRYHPPAVEDRAVWRKQVIEAMRADLAKWPEWEVSLDLTKVDALTESLTSSFDRWLAMSPADQEKVMSKVEQLAADLKDKPLETLMDMVREAAWRLEHVPSEAELLGTVALSTVVAAKLAKPDAKEKEKKGLPAAVSVTLAMLGGWLAADGSGAGLHWNRDNYPKGRSGKEFIDHHYNPRAVSKWPLRRNVEGMTKPGLAGLAVAAAVPNKPLAAFLLTMINGIIYTQHVHGYAHARKEETPKVIRALQSIPGLPILLPPREHERHHGKPLGKEAYGVLNGWSNYITEPTRFFRLMELVREQLTGDKPTWEHELEVRKRAMEAKKSGKRSMRDC